MNGTRLLVDIVQRYCAARGLPLETRADGWLLVLGQPTARRLIFGYDLGLNSAVAHRIASDKAATAEVLALAGVPAVPHRLVMAPEPGIVPEPRWAELVNWLESHPRGLVIKPNEGSSGRAVRHVREAAQIEPAVRALFAGRADVAISPWLAIETEVRVVLLDGKPLVVYAKERPTVRGDGVRSLRRLAHDAAKTGRHEQVMAELAGEFGPEQLDAVIPAGETRLLSWRHNLEFGARPVLLDEGRARDACVGLAAAAAQALQIRFASIDVVLAAGRWQVLEVNSGVMMEALGAHHPELVEAAYGAALDLLFAPR